MTAETNRSRYNLRPRPNKVEQCFSIVKCKKRLRHSLPYLSPDIIFNILIYLPADILYNVVRFVCREWFNIVSTPQFIDAHLKNAERGLLLKRYAQHCIHYIQDSLKKNNDNNSLQLVEVAYSEDEWEYGMSTSCNGLVVTYNTVEINNRRLVNFVTKEAVNLPPAPAGLSNVKFSSLGCTHLSKKYKLLEFFLNSQSKWEWGILTLGVDQKWRSIFQLHKETEIENFCRLDFMNPKHIISAEGILHVIHRKLPLIFSLDLETETFYTRAVPEGSKENRTYLGNGRSLFFMDKLGMFSWELWLLKDVETGEWTKLATIDLGPQETMLRSTFFPKDFMPVPVGFLKDGEIVIFHANYWENFQWRNFPDTHPSRNCITYNVKVGAGINSFHLDKGSTYQMNWQYRYIPYVKSLISPKHVAS